MLRELYRTHHTALSDCDLLILDVMFDRSVTYRMLTQANFEPTFNAPSHSLSDDDLKAAIQEMLRDNIVEPSKNRFGDFLSMTSHGGALWSSERCPVWDRYCTESYPAVIQGRTIMSVKAVSAGVRDDFLRLWPEYPARCRTARIRDTGLIGWHPFGHIHVGLASYDEPREWSCDEHDDWLKQHRAHVERVETERSWWRTVGELQKFVGV
jgi:hypothetical protein